MQGWEKYCKDVLLNDGLKIDGIKEEAENNFEKYGVYGQSINCYKNSYLFIIRETEGQLVEKSLIIFGEGDAYDNLIGEKFNIANKVVKKCPLSHENAKIIRDMFPFTAPEAILGNDKTIGLGDRLGLATQGHIKLIKEYDVKPIFAQQSIRELNLTGRTYKDVLDDTTWAVFQEGYKEGFGADGDHLKTSKEVEMALDCGYTMLTLDCSEHINNDIPGITSGQVDLMYDSLLAKGKSEVEEKYLAKDFNLKNGLVIKYTEESLKRTVLIYKKAVDFAIEIFNNHIRDYERDVDFEMSIDETLTSTSPEEHFFVANELIGAGVDVATIAPRFCGEFQKGIDYIGDIGQFEEEFKTHAAIAEHFGYKISVHSGSDKFAVFPIIGRETKGIYHVKTAGTNWLEAVRVIAQKAPKLYRELHEFALNVLDEAKKYYVIKADLTKIPDINKLQDSELPNLMVEDDSRQVIHITYGLILQAKNPDGTSLFRDRIYKVLNTYEEDYNIALYKHIGRHLKDLGN